MERVEKSGAARSNRSAADAAPDRPMAGLPATPVPAAVSSGFLAGLWSGAQGSRRSIAGLSGLRRALFAIGAGAFGVLGMAPFFFVPALLVSLVSLIWLLDGAAAGPLPMRIRRGALTAWCFAFGYFFAGLFWIGHAFMVEAETFAALMPLAISLLPAGLALFPALLLGLAMAVWRPGTVSRIVLFAALWTLSEWLRGHMFTGFPWNLIGLTWLGVPAMAQGASVVGIYGLSLLTALFCGGFARLGDGMTDRGDDPGEPRGAGRWLRAPLAMPLALTVLVAGIGSWGAQRIAAHPVESVPSVTLRLVQPNTAQTERLDRANDPMVWDRLVGLSQDARFAGVTHIIWPESAPMGFLARNPERLKQLGSSVLGPEMVLLTGSLRAEDRQEGGYTFYNGFLAVDESGRVSATYDKHHLVPFGEYMPFKQLFELVGIGKIAREISGLSAGAGPRTLAAGAGPAFSPVICYEIIFSGAVADRSDRPGWIVNVTDDDWFGNSTGPRQHLALARIRAVEEGLPVVRAANGGISAIIDPFGRVEASLALKTRGVLDGRLPKAMKPTIYSQIGDIAVLTAILIVVMAVTIGYILTQTSMTNRFRK